MLDANHFWSKTRHEGECQIWTGSINQEPTYGIFTALGGRLIAHRVAYELSVGPVPPHSHVGRTCQNPLCVSPKHLFLQDSTKALNPAVDAKRKIESQVEKIFDCWVWKGKSPKCIAVSSGIKTLLRAVYEIYHEPIPRGKEVVRTCTNEDCLNPEHLHLIDKAGLGKANSKFTLEQIHVIRKLAHTGEYGLMELAEMFGTSRQTIYTVVYNLGWKDINYTPPEKMPRRPRHCRKGHSLSGENLIVLESGLRKCRICLFLSQAVKKPRKTLEERFWEKVQKGENCWDWTAYAHKGWGYFNIDCIPQLAHRVAYELTYGQVPKGAKVLHSCENELCCRPTHLYLKDKNHGK